jgi:hypothetical protein
MERKGGLHLLNERKQADTSIEAAVNRKHSKIRMKEASVTDIGVALSENEIKAISDEESEHSVSLGFWTSSIVQYSKY